MAGVRRARGAVGTAELPFGMPVEIEGEADMLVQAVAVDGWYSWVGSARPK